ncbi:MAG TPA: FKBP-type peptidyl-prolyl cis-trans isomerase [Candidatus Acidoferrales bacterium]|nr:FKBP-type peptidyl-prolyl cis-trans isomerase [Candidatus Acidoferrales bacterium]
MATEKMPEIARGIALLAEVTGQGPPAARGDRIIFNMKLWLNRGDEAPLNTIQAQHLPEKLIRIVAGEKLVDHTATLGRREVVAGVERSLMGMKAGGYRKVRVSPHLAFREKGLPGLIPEHAVLVVEIWLREILPNKIQESLI